EACPTDSSFEADQDRANIAKSSTLPYDLAPRVTSPAADEGSMQLKLDELTGLCTSLQRQHLEMVAKFEAQELEINRLKARVKLLEDREEELEINRLKARVKLLEDREEVATERSRDDAPIKGMNLDKGEAAAERVSDYTKEMATVLTSIDAATVLASGVAKVPTGSRSIPTDGPPATEVPTGSDVVPTAELPLERRIELISDLIKYQDNYAKVEDFIPIGSKEEAKRFKRKGIRFEQESVKLKTSEEVPEEVKTPDEVPKKK
nr:hypothetical protein [Tanacetum cinerariifolium]